MTMQMEVARQDGYTRSNHHGRHGLSHKVVIGSWVVATGIWMSFLAVLMIVS